MSYLTRQSLTLSLLLISYGLPTCAQTPVQQLHKLIDSTWAFQLREHPLTAVFVGQKTQIEQLGDYTEASFAKEAAFYRQQLNQLNTIPTEPLSEVDRVNVELLRYTLEESISNYELKAYLNPLTSDYGPHIGLSFIPNYLTFRTSADYESYSKLLRTFPAYMGNVIAIMRQGLKTGMTAPKIILNGYEITYRNHIVTDPTRSVFYEPFLHLPASMSKEEQAQIQQDGQKAVLEGAVKGYQLFGHFMDTEYIPGARATLAAYDLPNGKAYYQQRVRHYTTIDLSPDAVHQMGLREVERIQNEMQAIITQTGFKGSFADFLKFLRTDSQFYAKTPVQLLKEASYIAKQAESKLSAFFGKLPRQPYGVAPVPDALAPKYTSGRYIGAPLNSKTPGYYWVNTYNLNSRPLYTLESLTLHEAVPGHHLQSALAKELADLPPFRKNLYVDAFGEGWGLYCEWLGKEMGFYKDPYSDFGRLTFEMWRASRLVVDTGIHAKGWTRQQVIDYLSTHTALSIHDCTTETDRYISWPGQALAYKIGELKIKEVRQKAQKSLGEKFDIRAFHDLILSQGTLTMPILERLVDNYIQSAK
ncbi:DUF885 domain-containing protein [Spirosoma sp. KCTC 42546]|uniref:DUF885 domain-containing protein n=1 Tax=Spirosoma sp. KCTC 42546 TaxID=2520506 RepID=UPI00115A6DA2|nr:DUF885 domain-containing protein [Spirosoma sp. KCTC 42546]QDK82248.1 DUF885 domain-containing protein [Spirosoma sp. KCTC 42546]